MSYHLLRFFFRIMSRLPFSVLYALSGVMYLLYTTSSATVGRLSAKTSLNHFLRKIATKYSASKKFYRYFADNIAESFKMSAMSPEEMGRRMRFTNVESVNTVLRQGTSVALYLGHYGNWEWVSSMPLHLKRAQSPPRSITSCATRQWTGSCSNTEAPTAPST